MRYKAMANLYKYFLKSDRRDCTASVYDGYVHTEALH